jgi:ElaA protein
MQTNWQWCSFSQLSGHEVYKVLALRQIVFVVGQKCVYLDADGYDPKCHHLLGWDSSSPEKELIAYLRVVPLGLKFAEMSVGRVLTAPSVRGTGLGKKLMLESFLRIQETFGAQTLRIEAQYYLEDFYQKLGFKAVSPSYEEDGILHVQMLRP